MCSRKVRTLLMFALQALTISEALPNTRDSLELECIVWSKMYRIPHCSIVDWQNWHQFDAKAHRPRDKSYK